MTIGDINYNIMTIVTNGLSDFPPSPGTILSTIVSILWPSSSEDVWDEIKDKVEALVDQKIDDYIQSDAEAYLNAVQTDSNDYQNMIDKGAIDLSSEAEDVVTSCNNAAPHLQLRGHEVLLLPYYAQL